MYLYIYMTYAWFFTCKNFQGASNPFTSCHSSTFGIFLRNPSQRWESKPAQLDISNFWPREKVSKELYVFLLKSVIPSNEKPFSHSLSLKGKTQCFILSFSIEFAHFLQDGPMDCHESRVQLSVATLINWMGLQHSWLGLAEINSHCNLRVRPPNLANQPIMNAWYPFPKGRNLSKFVGNSGSLVG